MNRLVEALARRSQTRERVLVTDPSRQTREVARAGAVLVLLAVAASGPLWAPPGSWGDVLSGLLLAVLAGGSVVAALRTKMAYRNGWLEGRGQMVNALAEAMRRGLTPEEWLEGELERDYAVMRVPEDQRHLADDEEDEG